jgi:hypothetical protein
MVVLAPPLTIVEDEVDEVLDVVTAAFERVLPEAAAHVRGAAGSGRQAAGSGAAASAPAVDTTAGSR